MTERLVSRRVPYLPITVELGRPSRRLEALLDTDFEGDLVIPETVALGPIEVRGSRVFQMADGTEITRRIYDGNVIVGQLGAFPVVVVPLGDECFMGLRLARRFAITLDHGREIVVEP